MIKNIPPSRNEPRHENRPAIGFWCAGDYLKRCLRCEGIFLGDKLALVCADCAYASPGEQFAKIVLDKIKERVGDGHGAENDDELLELAAKLGFGNVRRVKYDPEKHGEVCDAEPGFEIWFWGEEKL